MADEQTSKQEEAVVSQETTSAEQQASPEESPLQGFEQPLDISGAPVPPGTVVAQPGSGKATGALICGVLAIVFAPTVLFGIVLGVIALVLAVQYVRAFGKEGKATGAKVCGAIGLVLSIIALVFYIAVGSFISNAITSGAVQETIKETITETITESLTDSIEEFIPEEIKEMTDEDYSVLEKILEGAAAEVLSSLDELDEERIDEIIQSVEDEFYSQTGHELSDFGVDLKEVIKSIAQSLGYEGELGSKDTQK